MNKLILMISFFFVGCSTQITNVPNVPPEIKGNDVNQLETPEYGSLVISEDKTWTSSTLFFWKDGMSEAEVETEVRKVNTVSQEIDRLTTLFVEGSTKFAENNCLVFSTEPDAALGSVVWISLPAGDARIADLDACKKYQDDYVAGASVGDQIALFAELVQDGGGTLDATFNSITLRQPEKPGDLNVDMSLQLGLTAYGTAQGAAHPIRMAMYIPGSRVLHFEFDEFKAGVPTGLVYRATLERSADFLGAARFKGDLTLVNAAGQIVRNGSIQITGMMIKN